MNGQVHLNFKNRISGSGRLGLVILTMMMVVIQGWAAVFQDGSMITGTVVDTNNEPLIGATVMIKGTTTGTITDFDGKFMLNADNANAVLEVSYIGFQTKEVALNGRKTILVTLAEEQTVLQEVVVVGYGVQKKESVVGAISQVDNKALVQSGTTNITNALTGKLSGVMTMQTSGQPGANDAEIVIRGVSSWNGSEPLVLVDGVERDFSDIDPNEVQTISVLKDASATAVFGARGANGVIIVTTKEGKQGDPKFKVNAAHGISWATRIPQVSDAYTTLTGYNEYLKNNRRFDEVYPYENIMKHVNPSNPLEAVMYPDINWFDLLTHQFAHVTNANANVSGGTDFIDYFSSLGFTHETSLFDAYTGESKYHDTNYDYKRFNYRTNLNFKLSPSTKLQLKVGGDISINNQPENEPWRDIFGASGVNYPAYFPAWMLQAYPDLYYPDASGDRMVATTEVGPFTKKRGNPYQTLNSGSFTRTNSMKLFSDLVFNQKLDFITKGLSVQAKVALSTLYAHQSLKSTYKQQTWLFHPEFIGTSTNPWERYISTGTDDQYFTESPAALTVGGLTNYTYDLHYEASLNYNRTFGVHNVTALALMNRDIKNQKTEYAYKNEAWVGRLTYDYSHRYLVEVNMGYTGSERFAPSNRFGFFPSGAVGWVVSEEKFWKESMPWFTKFKLRYSDGLVGSDISDQRWLYLSNYTKDEDGNIIEDPGANLTAIWEQARKQDFGIEMGFFDDELTVGLDFFKEFRDQMLLEPRYNFIVGNEFKPLNLGSIKKHGYELEIGYRKHTEYGLDYNVKGMLSFSENRVLAKDDLPYAPDYMKAVGKPYGSQANGQMVVDDKYFQNVDDVHIYPASSTTSYMTKPGTNTVVDYNSDGLIDVNDVFCVEGSVYAPYVFSLSGGLSYKNFEISMVWSGNIGKYTVYDMTYVAAFGGDEVIMYENMEDAWTPTNPDATYNALGCNGVYGIAGGDAQQGYNLRLAGTSWQRADYIKLKDLNISYTFKSKKLQKFLGVNKLQLYLAGSNLLMFTSLPMGDPESEEYKLGAYPQMSSVKLGVNIDF